MTEEKQLGIGAHQDRTKRERIERLRRRLERIQAPSGGTFSAVKGIISGMLDILEDEL